MWSIEDSGWRSRYKANVEWGIRLRRRSVAPDGFTFARTGLEFTPGGGVDGCVGDDSYCYENRPRLDKRRFRLRDSVLTKCKVADDMTDVDIEGCSLEMCTLSGSVYLRGVAARGAMIINASAEGSVLMFSSIEDIELGDGCLLSCASVRCGRLGCGCTVLRAGIAEADMDDGSLVAPFSAEMRSGEVAPGINNSEEIGGLRCISLGKVALGRGARLLCRNRWALRQRGSITAGAGATVVLCGSENRTDIRVGARGMVIAGLNGDELNNPLPSVGHPDSVVVGSGAFLGIVENTWCASRSKGSIKVADKEACVI